MSVAKRNLWLNEDKTEVLTSEPQKGFVLAVEGAAMEEAEIKKYKIPASYYGPDPEPPISAPNIVISGGPDQGPGVVVGKSLNEAVAKGEVAGDKEGAKKALADEKEAAKTAEANADEEEDETTGKKSAKKSK